MVNVEVSGGGVGEKVRGEGVAKGDRERADIWRKQDLAPFQPFHDGKVNINLLKSAHLFEVSVC